MMSPSLPCVFPEILAAGTNRGRIALWRMVSQPNTKTDTKAQWKLQTPTEIEGNVTQLQVHYFTTVPHYTTVLHYTVLKLCDDSGTV